MPIPPYMWIWGLKRVVVQILTGLLMLKTARAALISSAQGHIPPSCLKKELDSSSPYRCKTVATGQTLKSAEVRFCNINDAGQEVCY